MSLFRELVEKHLPLAEAHLERSEELLRQQRARVAERKQRGLSSLETEKLLKNMEAAYELQLRHVAILRRDLARNDYGPPIPYQPPQIGSPSKPAPY
jgi:hypothetical protein